MPRVGQHLRVRVQEIEMNGQENPAAHLGVRFSEQVLQLIAAALGLGLYAIGLIALKWWVYPGWTWRG